MKENNYGLSTASKAGTAKRKQTTRSDRFVMPEEAPENLHIAFDYLHDVCRLPMDYLEEVNAKAPAPFYVDRDERIIFPNARKTYAEYVDTKTGANGIVEHSAKGGYYCTLTGKNSGIVLVTENAIDALCAHYIHGTSASASMCGLRDQTIDKILDDYWETVLSVGHHSKAYCFMSGYPYMITFRPKPQYRSWLEQVQTEGKLF